MIKLRYGQEGLWDPDGGLQGDMRLNLASIFVATAVAVAPSAAATLGVNFSNTTGQPLSNPPQTLGWSFTLISPVDVTWLSFFDSDQDGLAESHPLGIWNAAGTLLVSGTVSAGAVDPLHDRFRAIPVTPTLLQPGEYRIGALFLTGNDTNLFPTFTQDFSTAPEITFGRTANAVGGYSYHSGGRRSLRWVRDISARISSSILPYRSHVRRCHSDSPR